jgi:hypothetical protein
LEVFAEHLELRESERTTRFLVSSIMWLTSVKDNGHF